MCLFIHFSNSSAAPLHCPLPLLSKHFCPQSAPSEVCLSQYQQPHTHTQRDTPHFTREWNVPFSFLSPFVWLNDPSVLHCRVEDEGCRVCRLWSFACRRRSAVRSAPFRLLSASVRALSPGDSSASDDTFMTPGWQGCHYIKLPKTHTLTHHLFSAALHPSLHPSAKGHIQPHYLASFHLFFMSVYPLSFAFWSFFILPFLLVIPAAHLLWVITPPLLMLFKLMWQKMEKI